MIIIKLSVVRLDFYRNLKVTCNEDKLYSNIFVTLVKEGVIQACQKQPAASNI